MGGWREMRIWVWVEVECSIGESLACVKGRNSKPHVE